MTLLDGKATAAEIREEIAVEVQRLLELGERPPHLAAILVGDDGASQAYVGNKVRSCQKVGIRSTLCKLPADISQEALLAEIHKMNNDDELDGIIVQLPLPDHIDVQKITLAIDYRKDVDGFHPRNIGRMVARMGLHYLPATPKGIMTLLSRYQIPTSGKHCVVIGRSNIVGRPLSILLSQSRDPGNCTVTVCHSRTHGLKEICQQADIIIAALGRPGFVTSDMVREGAVIIDVGISRVDDAAAPRGYVLRGDVDYADVAEKCSFITPVPGGVGPMTVVSLLENTLQSRRNQMARAAASQ